MTAPRAALALLFIAAGAAWGQTLALTGEIQAPCHASPGTAACVSWSWTWDGADPREWVFQSAGGPGSYGVNDLPNGGEWKRDGEQRSYWHSVPADSCGLSGMSGTLRGLASGSVEVASATATASTCDTTGGKTDTQPDPEPQPDPDPPPDGGIDQPDPTPATGGLTADDRAYVASTVRAEGSRVIRMVKPASTPAPDDPPDPETARCETRSSVWLDGSGGVSLVLDGDSATVTLRCAGKLWNQQTETVRDDGTGEAVRVFSDCKGSVEVEGASGWYWVVHDGRDGGRYAAGHALVCTESLGRSAPHLPGTWDLIERGRHGTLVVRRGVPTILAH